MRLEDRNPGPAIRPLAFPLRECPHAVIETNRTCNIHCRNCYNLDKRSTKRLSQVEEEIDLACRLRRLQAITVVGGEPTLYPELTQVIRYIKRKALLCQIITNGLVLLQEGGENYLDSLVEAGLDKMLVHVDRGQAHVHGDIEKARRDLFGMLEARGMPFGLSVTVYNDGRRMLPRLARRYARYRHFEGILAVLARDPLPPRRQDVRMIDEYRCIAEEMGIEPSVYLPSNLDDGDVSWLVYLYFINAKTGRAFGLSSSLNGLIRRAYRLLHGTELFLVGLPPRVQRFGVVPAGLLESAAMPKKLRHLARLLRGSGLADAIRLHYIVIQNPPEYDEKRRAHRFCRHCPDATIRNGKLTPVCIADQVNPLPGNTQQTIDESLRDAVYAHLGS